VILLDTDEGRFGGHKRLEGTSRNIFFPIIREPWQNRGNYIQLYIPNRTAIILCAEENLAKHGLQINGRPKLQVSQISDINQVTDKLADVKI
jgi:hypothetical protein